MNNTLIYAKDKLGMVAIYIQIKYKSESQSSGQDDNSFPAVNKHLRARMHVDFLGGHIEGHWLMQSLHYQYPTQLQNLLALKEASQSSSSIQLSLNILDIQRTGNVNNYTDKLSKKHNLK